MKIRTADISGEGCIRLEEGTLSNSALHEELVEGVADKELRLRSKRQLLAGGLAKEHVDRLFSDLKDIP